MLREQLEKSSDKQPADGRNEMKCRSNESRLQVDLIDIEGYSGKAVKILIEYLLGYNYLLLTLKDLKVFADMLKICCSYDFKTCIIKVEETLNGVPISEDNLMDALNLLEVIQEIDEYQHTYEKTYDELYAKCLIVGQKSFSSKPKLIDFLVKNKSQTDKIFKLLSDNYFNQRESIRCVLLHIYINLIPFTSVRNSKCLFLDLPFVLTKLKTTLY